MNETKFSYPGIRPFRTDESDFNVGQLYRTMQTNPHEGVAHLIGCGKDKWLYGSTGASHGGDEEEEGEKDLE